MSEPRVLAVCCDGEHRFSKVPVESIELRTNWGVVGDAHAGETVQHRSRLGQVPAPPNLRQVHLMHVELFDGLAHKGFAIAPGDLGENITTQGVDLLGLGRDTVLRIGSEVVLTVTGLRNPCHQIGDFAPGLLKEVAVKTDQGIVRKSGIMTVVTRGGTVRAGDPIVVERPEGPHIPLERV